MKIWKISQNVNNNYDTYDSAIVFADTEEEARQIHPEGGLCITGACANSYDWVKQEDVTVEYIGEAKQKTEKGILLASFNAG